jgi:hypothetical protein
VINSRRLRWAGHVARMGERRGAYRALVGNLREGNHLKDSDVNGRIILKWIFERLEWVGLDWIDLAQDRDRWRALLNMVMNLRVPQNAGNFVSSLGHFSFSGRTLLHGVSYFSKVKIYKFYHKVIIIYKIIFITNISNL